jgi:hypothetical protein
MRTTFFVFVVGGLSLGVAHASAQGCPSGRAEVAPGHCCVAGDQYERATGLCVGSAPGAAPYAATFPQRTTSSSSRTAYDGERASTATSTGMAPPAYTEQRSAYTHDSDRRGGGHPLWSLFVPTFSLFIAAWIATPIVTASISHGSHAAQDIGVNAIPYAGPWVCFATCGNPSPYAWALVTSGLSQLVMSVLWIVALAVRVGGDDEMALFDLDGVRVTPWASTQGGGLAFDVDL